MSFGPLRSALADHLKQRIDYANSTTQYIGYASAGRSESDAAWAIQRLTFDGSGRITQVDWAGGNANADKVWTDRTTLSYS